jgi:hypothetical protein
VWSPSVDLESPILRPPRRRAGLPYKPEKKSEKVYGTGSLPIARTRGTADFTGLLEFYRADWDDFALELVSLEGRGPMDQEFDVVVSYGDDPTTAVTDVLSACRITSIDINPQQGDEPITVKVDLDVMAIRMNEIDLVPDNDMVT